jgi:predicted metal-dependent HD superfamily phosphohydrolase
MKSKLLADNITQAIWLINGYGIKITEKEVRKRYSEPHRHFHTIEHLNDVLSHIFDYYHNSDDIVQMIIAAIFHDIVYDPQRKDNEEKSIELLEFYTSESKYSDIIQQSKEIILSTKTHDKIHDLISNFNKFDCSILDKDLPDLLIWEEQIRKEYSFVPLDEYKKGRLEFLNLSLPNHQNNKENILQLIKIISPDCWWNISNHFKV